MERDIGPIRIAGAVSRTALDKAHPTDPAMAGQMVVAVMMRAGAHVVSVITQSP